MFQNRINFFFGDEPGNLSIILLFCGTKRNHILVRIHLLFPVALYVKRLLGKIEYLLGRPVISPERNFIDFLRSKRNPPFIAVDVFVVASIPILEVRYIFYRGVLKAENALFPVAHCKDIARSGK